MLKKLKNLFIVDDEEFIENEKGESKKQARPKKKAPSNPPPPSTDNSPPPPVSSAGPGKASSKFVQVLLGAMDKANLDGFDYLEYKQSLKSLEKMPMDEKTRYISAFAAAQTMGATPDKLVQAANHYLNVLQKEEQKFEQALVNQRSKQVGNKQQQIKQSELLIKEKTEQIKKLTHDIEQHKKLREKLSKEISGATVKVEQTKNNFIASYKLLVAQIQQDVDNIKKYLK